MNPKQLDILAVGDTVIDAFIRLQDAEVHCNIDNENCMLSMRFGDKIPYESVEICNAVGNSANGAVSASRLGLSSALFAYVGDDQNGKDCFESLKKDGVDTTYLQTEAGKKTNYHYVLWYDVDRTILVKHEAFNYDFSGIEKNGVVPKWIYLSSLGENSLDLHNQIAEYLTAHPEVKLAFQPGTFQIKFGIDKLHDIYSRSNIFCCNVEEAQKILGEQSRDLKILLQGIAKLGHEIVLITDGMEGAYAYDSQDQKGTKAQKFLFMPIYPHTPFERTGAGDAFFSTIVSCLAMGKTLAEALTWGPINSQSVVQQVGAQKGLLAVEKIKEFLAKAPATYALKEI
jgi:ribokinase